VNTCTCEHTESCHVADELSDAKKEIERLYPCHRFAMTLPPGRSFVEFGGNISGRLYAMKSQHDETVSQLAAAKLEIEQLKITHINQADVINRHYADLAAAKLDIVNLTKDFGNEHAKLTAANLEIARINQVAEEELDEVNGKVEKLTKTVKFFADMGWEYARKTLADTEDK